MAGDWIKMQTCLPDKPEVWRIASIIGCEPDAVIGKLLRVWSWFDSHTEDGNAVGVTYSLVDRVSGVTGFAEAMALCGWLEQRDLILSLPKFDRHNGKTAKNRALTNERVAKSRSKSNAECNGVSVTKTVTREEKRREDISKPPTEVGKTGKPVIPPCPIDEIISVYHETCPMLPRFQVRNDTRDGYIRSRWKQFFSEGDFTTKEGGLDCFRWFFENKVGPSKFLTGQSEGRNGAKPFIADLEWLMRPTNFAKVIEGKYA